MAGYLGTKAVLLSTTAADVVGNAEIGGDLTVDGAFTSQGIDDNASATAMTLDASGKVGIGTSSPSTALHVSSSGSGTQLSVDRNITLSSGAGAGTILLKGGNTSGANSINYAAINSVAQTATAGSEAGALVFNTLSSGSTSERMRIDSSGNLLVGTGASYNTVGPRMGGGNTSSAAGTNFLNFWPEGNGTSSVKGVSGVDNTAGRTHFWFVNPNGVVGGITTSGSATSFNTSSDYRLKTDAQPMTGASARVQALKPVNFEWIADGTRVDGFLAHEAQEVVPEAVTGAKDAMRDEEYEVTPAALDDDGNVVTPAVMGTRSVPDYQGIDQSKLVPLLTAALQEALTEIADLKARVTALEAV